ncbi:DUF885 family protein [Pedobacter sp. PWIIR3]
MLKIKSLLTTALVLTVILQSEGQTKKIAVIMEHYQADTYLLRDFYTIQTAPETRTRFKTLANDYLKQLEAEDFNSFTVGDKVDYLLFKRDLQESLLQLSKSETEYEKVKGLFPFADQLYSLEKLSRRGTTVEGQKIAEQLNTINKQLKTLTATGAVSPKLEPATAMYAATIGRDLRKANKTSFDFYNQYDPMYSWWVPATYKVTDSLLHVYSRNIAKNVKTPETAKNEDPTLVGNPVGRAEIVRKLNQEMIAYTPEELIEMANRELAWCDKEMLAATKEMGLGTDWRAAMEKVKNTYVAPGKQPELIVKLYNDALDFIKPKDLITIPPLAEETWGMIMMTPQRQLVNPFFTGGSEISISYPTAGMEYDDKMMSMRGNNPYFSRGTVQHELIPGHNLEYFMMRRYNTHRNFDTPFWMEGWALYWELLLYDMGFAKTPEERIGMLFWRKHRCARIIFSLNYQLGNWSPKQCIDFLVDRVGHERANAEGEVRRSIAPWTDPLYQVGYLTGGLQIWALKKELVDSKKMTFKQFHDAIMQENNMTIEMLRAILTKQNLTKDFKTSWRFYDLKK